MEARSSERERGRGAEVVVFGPDGAAQQSVTLSRARMSVGRLPELNDIALQPDLELFVTRESHCTFEQKDGHWFVVDGGSVNGTYVRRDRALEKVVERMALHDGDVVCVLASVTSTGERRFFELAFHGVGDSQATRAAPMPERPLAQTKACLAYDADAARLVLIRGDTRDEIRLRPQGHRLVRYMAERNAGSGGTPVLCSHAELMHAVWEDEPMHTRLELARLVWELRRELRRWDAQDLVESERRRGYRLRTCPHP